MRSPLTLVLLVTGLGGLTCARSPVPGPPKPQPAEAPIRRDDLDCMQAHADDERRCKERGANFMFGPSPRCGGIERPIPPERLEGGAPCVCMSPEEMKGCLTAP